MSVGEVLGLSDPVDETAFASSVESTLSLADEPIETLHKRIAQAFRYCASWFDAVKGSGHEAEWGKRIADVMNELTATLAIMPLLDVFPGNQAKASYQQASADFAQLYRDLALSADTLPKRALLDQLGDIPTALFQAPTAAAKWIAEQAAQTIGNVLGNTVAAIWRNLWPFLLVAGGAGVVWLFRAPLGRALGKVTK